MCRTHRRGKLERVLVLAGGKLRRCEGCHVRFLRWRGKTIYPDRARAYLQRTRHWILMAGWMVMVVWLLLWLINRPSGPPPEG